MAKNLSKIISRTIEMKWKNLFLTKLVTISTKVREIKFGKFLEKIIKYYIFSIPISQEFRSERTSSKEWKIG